MIGVRAFWLALRAVWEEFYAVVMAALVGFLCLLTLILAPVALVGNYVLARRIADQRAVGWRDWWEGARAEWRVGYKWTLLNLGVIFLLLFNFNFYGARIGGTLGSLLAGVWLMVLFLWLATQFYVLPLYLMQQQRRLRLALRNAALLAVTDPLTTLALMALTLLLVAALYIIAWPLLLLLPPFLALAGTHATRLRLIRDGLWRPDDLNKVG